jgi:hypothetical protein
VKCSIKLGLLIVVVLLVVGPPAHAQVGLGAEDPREMGAPKRQEPEATAPVKPHVTQKPSVQVPPEATFQQVPPFHVVVTPIGEPRYLEQISIKVKLVPRPGSADAAGAVRDKRTILYIAGEMVEERTVNNEQAFIVSTRYVPRLKLKPGNHPVEALVLHEGGTIKGTGTLVVQKGNAKFIEGTSPHIYYGHSGAQYLTCHHEGDVLDISVKVVNASNGTTPVINSPIEYKVAGGIVACSGKTDYNGNFNCSLRVSREIFPSVDFWDEPRHPEFVQALHHFNLPENELYKRTFDTNVYRSLCVCAKGRTFNRPRSKCE